MYSNMTKILVVEDAVDLRESVMELLELEGFEVLGAEDGIEALSLIRTHKPDLVVCDIMMPELDGYGVLEQVRKQPETLHLPFIFLTAQSDKTYIRDGMRMGADDFLTKPFSPSELLGSIHQRLAYHQQKKTLINQPIDDLRQSIATALPHELRTPLNSIMGYADLIASDKGISSLDQIQEWARHIQSSAKRLLRLTENYLYYTRLRMLTTLPDERTIYVQQEMQGLTSIIMDEVIKLAARYRREEDVKVQLESVGAVRCSLSDAIKVLEELLDNAFKFSEPASPVSVQGYLQSGVYLLTIQDQGRGISEEQLSKIAPYIQFERDFFEQQGVGLGLHLARHIMELFGGQLKIESQLNQGTRVTVLWRLV